jgi:hypothetical protein
VKASWDASVATHLAAQEGRFGIEHLIAGRLARSPLVDAWSSLDHLVGAGEQRAAEW